MREVPPTQRPASRGTLAVVGLVAAIAGGLSLFWLWPRPAAPPPPAPVAAPAPEPADGPRPPVDPARVRALLAAFTAAELFGRCAFEEEPLRRTAIVLDNLGEGVSPGKQLACAAPARPLGTVVKGGRRVLDPASHARFDRFVDAAVSVDAGAVAAAWRELHPVLEWTYRQLGYPGASLDVAAARALRRLENAPVVEGDVLLVEGKGATWLHADPKLEGLAPVEKQLLRMGPRNTRLLQAKARELEAALGLGAVQVPARRP